MQKRKLQIIVVLMLLIVGFIFVMNRVDAQEAPAKCPPGSYDIGISKDGELICKLEPTGCPYGDSIPLGPQCDKHKPKPVKKPRKSVKQKPVRVYVPQTNIYWGK